MCGVVGVCSSMSFVERDWLAKGRDLMAHRGPDDAGEWWSEDGRVGLAHRRLSIIDLSPLGQQPMHLAKCGLSIVFNGEIYNHRDLRKELSLKGFVFHSHCDTEVLLAAYAAWGENCLPRLNGMFAFAIYDAKKQRLFLARDRAGEKPLFYHFQSGTICFASELKALLSNPEIPREVDIVALDCYLSMGYVPGKRCMLKGFNKLPPAHALTFNLSHGDLKTWSYWQLPEVATYSEIIREPDLLEELEKLLEDSVKQQMIADVALGVLLSGGIDSSLVTAMAVRNSSKVKTFNISFPGYGKYDETEHARLIANYFGTEHIELEANPASAELIPILARQFDEPIVDSSMLPTFLVCKLVRQHCTVALGGDGGDELFGGYKHYNRLLWMKKNFEVLSYPLRHLIATTAENFLPPGLKGRNWLQGLGTDLRSGVPQIALYFDSKLRKDLLPDLFPEQKAEQIREMRIPASSDILQRATRMDFENYLAEDILVKVDRTSMLNSLEVRAPMLDYRIIEFAFKKVPSNLKAISTDKKILLKKLTQKLLPPEFDLQRKQGFSIPLANWLKKGEFRELFYDKLLSSNCIFNRKVIKSLLQGQDAGLINSERIFALVLFELWRREYRVSL